MKGRAICFIAQPIPQYIRAISDNVAGSRDIAARCCELEGDISYFFCPLPDEVDRSELETCLEYVTEVIDCEYEDQDPAECAADSESFALADLHTCCGYDSSFYFCRSI